MRPSTLLPSLTDSDREAIEAAEPYRPSSKVIHLLRPQRCAVARWGLACGRPASSALIRDGRLVVHCVRHLAAAMEVAR